MEVIQVNAELFIKNSEISHILDDGDHMQLCLKTSEWVQVSREFSELLRLELGMDEIKAKSYGALAYLKAVDNFRQWKLVNKTATHHQITREMIRYLPKIENAPRSLMYKSVVVVAPFVYPEDQTAQLHRWVIKMTHKGYSMAKETLIGERWQWDNAGLIISIEFKDCGTQDLED